MQFTINSFRQLFPDNSLIFSKIPDIYLTAVKFLDISRFSRQVITLFLGLLQVKLNPKKRPLIAGAGHQSAERVHTLYIYLFYTIMKKHLTGYATMYHTTLRSANNSPFATCQSGFQFQNSADRGFTI